MARFALREFSVPDYRSSLPEKDPNNAIWPRISAFAKMLHDMSWEDGDDEELDDGTGRSEEERAADFEQNARENVKTSEDKKMDGYSEYLDDQSRLTEDEKKTQGAEQQLEDERNRKNIGFGGDRSGGIDRQRQLAEDAGTGFRKAAQAKRDAVGSGGDMGEMFPDVFVESPTYQEAMTDYLNQLDWENADSARQAQRRSEMAGYRPLPTR